MTKVGLLCAALLGAGCGDDGNRDLPDAPHGDARIIDGPGSDAPVQTRTIDGTATYHYLTESGDVAMPNPDLSAATVYGYSLEGGAWVARPGQTGQGTFSFPVDQDAASWMWGVVFGQGGSIGVHASSSDAPDLSEYFLGRADAAYPTQDTETTFALSGMSPWVTGDVLELITPGNGGTAFDIEQFPLTAPNDGDTTVAQTFDWEETAMPLTDASKNDTLNILHLAQITSGNFSYDALTDLAQPDGLTQVDGQANTVTASFSSLERNETYALDWHGSQFDALRADVGAASGTAVSGSLGIDALPDASNHGFYNSAPDLALWFGGSDDATGTIAYANPFPYSKGRWDEFLIYSYFWNIPVHLGSTTATLQAGIYGYDALGNLASVAPTLSPPTCSAAAAAIGRPGTRVTGATATPTFSWAAPATGTPTAYLVTILQGHVQSGFAYFQTVASFTTSDTTLTVPANYLSSGTVYIATISAVHTDTDLGAAPLLDHLGYVRADAVTAPFEP